MLVKEVQLKSTQGEKSPRFLYWHFVCFYTEKLTWTKTNFSTFSSGRFLVFSNHESKITAHFLFFFDCVFKPEAFKYRKSGILFYSNGWRGIVGGPKFITVLICLPFIFLAYRARFSPRLMVKKKNERNVKSYELIEVLYMYDIINLAIQLSVTKHLMWHILLW